jgi:hypothetical protein
MRLHRLAAPLVASFTLLAAPAAFAGDGSSLLGLLPSNAVAVGAVDVDALRSAPIFQQLSSLATGTDEYGVLATRLSGAGIDPVRDVHTIVYATPTLDESRIDDEGLVLIEATFERAGLEAALATAEGAVRSDVGSVAVFTKGLQVVAVLSDRVVAVGHADLVGRVVAAQNGDGGGLPSGLRSHARSAAGGTMWAAALAPAGTDEFTAARGRVTISSSVAATVTAVTNTPEEAATLAQRVNTEVGALTSNPQVAAFGLGAAL